MCEMHKREKHWEHDRASRSCSRPNVDQILIPEFGDSIKVHKHLLLYRLGSGFALFRMSLLSQHSDMMDVSRRHIILTMGPPCS